MWHRGQAAACDAGFSQHSVSVSPAAPLTMQLPDTPGKAAEDGGNWWETRRELLAPACPMPDCCSHLGGHQHMEALSFPLKEKSF